MEIFTLSDIVTILLSIIFTFIMLRNQNVKIFPECLEERNLKVLKSTLILGLGLFLGSMLALITNHIIYGKTFLPYHESPFKIIFDALKYLVYASPFIFVFFYILIKTSCNTKKKVQIALRATLVFLVGFIVLLPTSMNRINIKYDVSSVKNKHVQVFDKHKSKFNRNGYPSCRLKVQNSLNKFQRINLGAEACDSIDKFQELTLEYRLGYLGYEWVQSVSTNNLLTKHRSE